MLSSLLKLQIEWDDNEEFYRAWEEARTGYPWIDAIMTQLREQGWMHHLARHAVVRLKTVLQSCICSIYPENKQRSVCLHYHALRENSLLSIMSMACLPLVWKTGLWKEGKI